MKFLEGPWEIFFGIFDVFGTVFRRLLEEIIPASSHRPQTERRKIEGYDWSFAPVIPWIYDPGFAKVIPWIYDPSFARTLSKIKGSLGGLASLGPLGARLLEGDFEANFSYSYAKLEEKKRAQRRTNLSKSNGRQRKRSRKRGERNQQEAKATGGNGNGAESDASGTNTIR